MQCWKGGKDGRETVGLSACRPHIVFPMPFPSLFTNEPLFSLHSTYFYIRPWYSASNVAQLRMLVKSQYGTISSGSGCGMPSINGIQHGNAGNSGLKPYGIFQVAQWKPVIFFVQGAGKTGGGISNLEASMH